MFVYQHHNYKCLRSILFTFYAPTDNDIRGIIYVDAQLKYIIINYLGMTEIRCYAKVKLNPHLFNSISIYCPLK